MIFWALTDWLKLKCKQLVCKHDYWTINGVKCCYKCDKGRS